MTRYGTHIHRVRITVERGKEMELRLVRVTHKRTGIKHEFDVHAKDEEQALEVVINVITEWWGGSQDEYVFHVGEPDNEPQVISYERTDNDK
jgi:hypothetical protein